jgi:predicted metal-binding protein
MTCECRCCHRQKPFTYVKNEYFTEAFCRKAFVCQECRDKSEARRTAPRPGRQVVDKVFERAINLPYKDA